MHAGTRHARAVVLPVTRAVTRILCGEQLQATQDPQALRERTMRTQDPLQTELLDLARLWRLAPDLAAPMADAAVRDL